MSSYVLDSSALLALLNQEPGRERVEAVLSESAISVVNFCEVVGKLIDAGMPEAEALESVDLLNIEIVGFDREAACLAAGLRPTTKKFGLSLGDRSCLALSIARRNTAVTAERVWSKLKIGITIDVIR